jgi:TolA-binding protein
MSTETRSPADAAFERRLLESAREDAEPRDVEAAWARLAGGLATVLPDRGGAPGRLPMRAAEGGGGARTVWAHALKWMLVGAIAGSGLTGALLIGRRPSPLEWPVSPAAQAGQAARPPEPPGERPAALDAPRAVKHRLAHSGAPSRQAAAPSTLAEQVSRIDTARVAIASGDYDEAIRLVGRYHDDFPDGALAPDADVVALEAAAAKDDRAEVVRRARSFLARYPNDPHAARVEWLADHPGGR